jgi:hypothetical protein
MQDLKAAGNYSIKAVEENGEVYAMKNKEAL